MKKLLLSLGFVFLMTVAFAANGKNGKAIIKVKAKKPVNVEVCVTKSSTITNDNIGVSVTVSCTRCDESPVIAGMSASLCASNYARRMAPIIAN